MQSAKTSELLRAPRKSGKKAKIKTKATEAVRRNRKQVRLTGGGEEPEQQPIENILSE